jgi:hypothetical protein
MTLDEAAPAPMMVVAVAKPAAAVAEAVAAEADCAACSAIC